MKTVIIERHDAASRGSRGGAGFNRLINAKSPYLLQHAHNPVDWFEWGEEAFEKARREDKPIFLSIGYSTCHWCHVMERESFEDEEVAKVMNEVFVSIKVDREERPDIDGVYMTACQAMTGSGGWPLSIIMTPEGKPFFAGTYIPKESGYGRVGIVALTEAVREVWKTRRQEAVEAAESVGEAVKKATEMETKEFPEEKTLKQAGAALAWSFDEIHGGFGEAPKFPRPHALMLLLRWWKRSGDAKALAMVEKTLAAMRAGGIYDQVGFGLHRYSTDARWLVPHFEKMLYDQALYVMANVEAWQATHKPEYERTAREVISYVMREMRSPEGGFYSAQDADSEGEEGKFYTWTAKEMEEALGEEAGWFMRVFGAGEIGNWTGEESVEGSGTNILHMERTPGEIARAEGRSEEEVLARIEAGRRKLLAARERRVHPFRDDKILTDWNGLMIAALAKAGSAFGEEEFVRAAQRAAEFIWERMGGKSGRPMHRFREGEAAVKGYLEDYAFLAWGLIELYQADFEVKWLERALAVSEEMTKHFWDERSGGFFQSADDGEALLVRRRDCYDGATPSGNSAAAMNLLRLARMTGREQLETKALSAIGACGSEARRAPTEGTMILAAMDYLIGPATEIMIAGKRGSADTKEMIRALRREYLPNAVAMLRDESKPEISRVAPFTARQLSLEGKATAYVCRDFECKPATTSVEEMMKL